MTSVNLLAVASEIYPLVKTGGLADVTGALPRVLAEQGIAVRTLVPGYPAVMEKLGAARAVLSIVDLFGDTAKLLAGSAAGLDLLVLDAPHLYRRPGNPYLAPDGKDWADNPQRFAALAQIAARIGAGAVPEFRPDILHGHDWQAGLMAAYCHFGGAHPPIVFSVHNLAFPGMAPPALLERLGLPLRSYAIDGVEFHGNISFLKAGLQFADRITTVSPNYAMEILTPEFGMGFDGLLRSRAGVVSGILNGIDADVWNPATDPAIAANYDRAKPARRAANKEDVQARFGLARDATAPLFGVVSRLTWQKRLDLLLDCLPALESMGAQLAVLGAGEAGIEAAFTARASTAPGRIGCIIGYDEQLAHRMQAGVDMLLVPSRFEPCGLTQLCALRYGAVPVVSRVGGLADTVIDANPASLASGVATGLQFAPVTADALGHALRRVVALYRNSAAWRRMQRNGMAADWSWDASARDYAALYRGLLA